PFARMLHMNAKTIVAVVVLALARTAAAADSPPYYPQQEGVCYQDCVSHSCKLVPDKKQIKKIVYEVQEVPYCLKKLPPFFSLFPGNGCGDCEPCADCQCPRYKRVLVKKEVVCDEICITKCVVQEHVERVPCQPCQPPCGYSK